MHKSTKIYKNNWTNRKNMCLKLSTIPIPKSLKNRVIHEVIHVIHKKPPLFHSFEMEKSEQPFCEDFINFDKLWKIMKI